MILKIKKRKYLIITFLVSIGLNACSGSGSDLANSRLKALGTFGPAQSCAQVIEYVDGYAARYRQFSNQAVSISHGYTSNPPPSVDHSNSPDVAAGESSSPAFSGAIESDFAFSDHARGLLYTFTANRELQIYRVSPLQESSLLTTLPLDFFPQEMLLMDVAQTNYAIVFGTTQPAYLPLAKPGAMPLLKGSSSTPTVDSVQTVTLVLDMTDTKNPQQVYREMTPGIFWTARGISDAGQVAWFLWRDISLDQNSLEEENILPSKTQSSPNGTQILPATDCNAIYLYQNDSLNQDYAPSGLTATVVSVLNLANLEAGSRSEAIFSPAWNAIVQANPEHLFLAQNIDGPERTDTELFMFDLGKDSNSFRLRASGSVNGQILNRHFIDEKNGFVRIFHHVPFGWSNEFGIEGGAPSSETSTPMQQKLTVEKISSGNYLSILQLRDTKLQLVGQSGPFETEEVPYSARFMGEFGCVITFQQIDPLTCFDLKEPTQPKSMGSLELSGVTSHLEPVTKHLWLGIGRGGNADSVVANLFDVKDPAKPVLADQKILSVGLSNAYSPVFYDDRALGKNFSEAMFAVPVEGLEKTRFSLLKVDIPGQKLVIKGNIDKNLSQNNDYDPFQRGFLFDDGLATLSYQKVTLFDLQSLQEVSTWDLTP